MRTPPNTRLAMVKWKKIPPSDMMRRHWGMAICVSLACFGLPPSAHAFALLGPYAPWMTPDIGYPPHYPPPEGDIGGPMALGEEYRWNVPVVTYGFDQSFLDYFGHPGVDAVEQAIRILNDLPPASSMVLSNYAFDTHGVNYAATRQNLYDLKSTALFLLLEQVGLAQPVRYTWALRRWNPALAQGGTCMDWLCLWRPDTTNDIVQRNYDPISQLPSYYVNGFGYGFYVESWTADFTVVDMRILPIDPIQSPSAVCDAQGYWSGAGNFFTGLTRDDAGGLLYLLNRTNVNVEALDDSITPVGDSITFVRTALRPGVEKLDFIRHPTDASGRFLSMTYEFTDTYFTNGVAATQVVQRTVVRPDFVFSARDLGFIKGQDPWSGQPYVAGNLIWQRTDTSRWANNNVLNGSPDGDGPGVIRPPVQITFHTPGRYVAAAGGQPQAGNVYLFQWASFDASTNIVVFPGNQTNIPSLTLGTQLVSTNGTNLLQWDVLGHVGARYRIETSPDLSHWTTNSVVNNSNGVFRVFQPADGPQQYFRAVLEE